MPMVENRGVLYIVSVDEIFASTDNGQTWKAFCFRPKGKPVGLVVIDEAKGQKFGYIQQQVICAYPR